MLPAPLPQVIISPRSSEGLRILDLPVDEALLEAGDHNGATFYQHMRFAEAITNKSNVDVTLQDGSAAVGIAFAAQQSVIEGRAIKL